VHQPVRPHLLYARIWQNISAASFFRCKLIWGINEFVVLPYFNAPPDIFVVTNCCIVVLGVVSYDSISWSLIVYIQCNDTQNKDSGCIEKCACFVKKLRLNIGLETGQWRQIVMSQRPHTKYKWLPHATEWKPLWKFAAYATGYISSK